MYIFVWWSLCLWTSENRFFVIDNVCRLWDAYIYVYIFEVAMARPLTKKWQICRHWRPGTEAETRANNKIILFVFGPKSLYRLTYKYIQPIQIVCTLNGGGVPTPSSVLYKGGVMPPLIYNIYIINIVCTFDGRVQPPLLGTVQGGGDAPPYIIWGGHRPPLVCTLNGGTRPPIWCTYIYTYIYPVAELWWERSVCTSCALPYFSCVAFCSLLHVFMVPILHEWMAIIGRPQCPCCPGSASSTCASTGSSSNRSRHKSMHVAFK